MKRSPWPELTDLSTPPRRKRALSEAERELWESVAKQAKPLRKQPQAARPPPAAVEAKSAATKPMAAPKLAPDAGSAKAVRPDLPVAPPLATLSRRERSRLSRGKKDIDARLDLHGMTLTRAHHALFAFLQRANSNGLTFVLIITGKGRVTGAESGRGVLRRQVPLWLSLPEFRSLVVGFEEAHIGHGGEGALYVRVRRRTRR
jgi:DNA-nicking Smr family endonuclease